MLLALLYLLPLAGGSGIPSTLCTVFFHDTTTAICTIYFVLSSLLFVLLLCRHSSIMYVLLLSLSCVVYLRISVSSLFIVPSGFL